MLVLQIFVLGIMGTAIGLTTRYFSPQELQDRFSDGQKLYALGDYEKAVPHFEAVLATKNNATINVDQVTVTLDEFILPARVAARYQLGNAHNKLGQDLLRRTGFLRSENKSTQADARYEEALAEFKTSLDYFASISAREDIEERTRVMAQFQTLETNYKLKRYDHVIKEGERLLEAFPNSVYETAAYYNIGWSYFELKDYEQAIGNFKQVITLSPRGSHSDRSYFQIAESYDALTEYPEALKYFQRLIRRYDFSTMSEKELIEMASLKLKGLVEETSREMVAKAQLRRGDILAEMGRVDEALTVYALVPTNYPTETVLVHGAYIRGAELVQKERGTSAALSAYRNAIENVENKRFQARTQLTIAGLLYDEGEYEKAAGEYEIYMNAYSDVADRIGFGEDKVLYQISQCYQARASNFLRQDEPENSKRASERVTVLLDQILRDHQDTDLKADVLFQMAYNWQMQKDDRAADTYRDMVASYPDHPAAPSALLQLARIDYESRNYEVAKLVYLRFLDEYPQSNIINQVRLELAMSLKNLEQTEAAIEVLETISEDWSEWAKIQAELADLHVRRGNTSRAQVVLDRALQVADGPDLRGQLLYVKSRIHFKENQYEEAVIGFSEAMQLPLRDDILDGSLLFRGSSHYELAKFNDARGDTAVARVRYEDSIVDMKALLDRDPAANIKDSAFRTLGAGMIRLQREDEAVRYYSALIEASDDPQQRATFQMLLTELYFDQQLFDYAEKMARELLQMTFEDDNSAGYYRKERAYSIIGNALLKRKNYKAASDILATGLKLYPNSGESANISFSRAFADFNAGDYVSSAEGFAAYTSEHPADRNAVHGHYYLAHSYQMLTNFEKAATTFRHITDRFPEASYVEEAMFLIGENYYNQRDFPAAAEAYRELLDNYPRGRYSDSALYSLAWCQFEQEDMAGGVARMAVLVKDYPDSDFAAKAQFTVGDFHYNNREYDQALVAYRSLIENYAGTAEAGRAQVLVDELSEIEASIEYSKVMARFEEKDYEKAITGFQSIIKNYPGTYTQLAAYCNLGLTYEILRKWPEAVENYDKTLSNGDDDIENSDVVNFARIHRDWIVENRL